MIVANGRWVPPSDFEAPDSHGPMVGLCDGQPAFAVVGPEDAMTLDPHGIASWFDRIAARHAGDDVGGEWMNRPWDLVARNGAYIERDFRDGRQNGVTNRQLATLALVGPSNLLRVHETARIDPYTVFDTTTGPIVVGPNVWVQPFTRVEGPCYIGPETQLFRANIRGSVSIGPNCRIGGEVEDTIVQGFSNKYHEGFLGHAYIGEWVNLGAITSNSDLRNDYGEVHVPLQGDPVPTGQAKVGCFIGDHTRTGMGSMLNTGTAIGVMCNVLPAGLLLPKHVPSFTAVLYGRVGSGLLARPDVRHRPDRHGPAGQDLHGRGRTALPGPLRADSPRTRAGLPAIPRPSGRPLAGRPGREVLMAGGTGTCPSLLRPESRGGSDSDPPSSVSKRSVGWQECPDDAASEPHQDSGVSGNGGRLGLPRRLQDGSLAGAAMID